MATYRAYPLDDQGAIGGPAIEFDSVDNEAAIEHALRYVTGCDIELWRGAKPLAVLRRPWFFGKITVERKG